MKVIFNRIEAGW